MPVKVYRRKGSLVYSYRGTVAGRRLRGSTSTTDKIRAERIAATKEIDEWKYRLDGPEAVLTFAKAALLYRAAGKSLRFLPKIEDYWKDMLVRDIKPGAIRQAAIEMYPTAGPATRNRQAIVPTQAIINHCADSEMCPPIRVKRFKVEKKIVTPHTLNWIDAFVEHAVRPEIAALAVFMFATGARVSEALRVQWEDIDFKMRRVAIRKTKISEGRVAHLPQRLLIMLANLPRDHKPFFYKDRNSAIRSWDNTIKRAGIEKLSFHKGRHGFATATLRKKIDPKTAAWLGGWKSIRHFMETYAHEIQDITLSDKIFDTDLTPLESLIEQKQQVKK